MDGMNALDALLDGTTGAEQQEDVQQQEGQQDEGQQEQQQPETPPAQPPKQQNKQDYAFAQLRTQNTQYKNLVNKVAQAMGIEFKDDTELITKLNDDALNKLAGQQKVPVELLKRLEMLEQRDQIHEAERRQQAAAVGFQTVKKTYGLTDEELMAYANELDTDNKNPFVMDIDLLADYKLRHYDDIMQKRIDAAVQAALTKNSAADTHSSKPNSTGGRKTDGTPEQINTVTALNNLLDGK